jgi:hypothetical protein
MQGKHLFEYAVIRIVPRVEREEFLNIGVIVYCQQLKFLEMMFTLDDERLRAFYPAIDLPEVEAYLEAFEKISGGDTAGGPIARLDTASRFRWLTAVRSTIVQVSKVHTGLCDDPHEMLVRLHAQLVL